jgi:osmotically-inducible protein OsmY
MAMVTAADARTDPQIQRDVLAELEWDARVRPNEIGVAVKDGVVTLMGWVDSYPKKWAAEEAAHRVRGVLAVANDLEVRLAGGAERTDPDLAAAAARALAWNALLPGEEIDVTVAKGWVTLKGEVEWQFKREEGERAVRNLMGVRGVINQIAVKPRSIPSGLKENIEEALRRNAHAAAARITVGVQGDKVMLKGTVRTRAERDDAERVAWSAPGVTSVETRIAISD